MTANNQFYTQGDGGFINVSENFHLPISGLMSESSGD